MNGTKLQAVDKFTYLGSTLSRAVHIDDEVTFRTAKASVAFGRLRTNVWERNGIRLDTKLKVYKAVVLPTHSYACETWTVYQRHAKKLNHFHLSCLRKILTRFDVYETLCPNRCLYIKVAKLRTGVGSVETSYLQNCSVKLFKEHFKDQNCKGRCNNFFLIFTN